MSKTSTMAIVGAATLAAVVALWLVRPDVRPEPAQGPLDAAPAAQLPTDRSDAVPSEPTVVRTYRLRLVDERTDRPLAATPIELRRDGEPEPLRLNTDQDGWFSAGSGTWRLTSAASPPAFRDTVLETGSTAAEVYVQGIAWLRVVVDGASPSPARVMAFPANAKLETVLSWDLADADRMRAEQPEARRFESIVPSAADHELATGTWQVVAAHPGLGAVLPRHPAWGAVDGNTLSMPSRGGPAPVSAPFTLAPGEVQEVEIRVDATLSLRILPESFAPAPHIDMTLYRFHPLRGASGSWQLERSHSGEMFDAAGHLLTDLRPARYRVSAVARMSEASFRASSQLFELDPDGRETVVGLDAGVGPWTLVVDTVDRTVESWTVKAEVAGGDPVGWRVYGYVPLQGTCSIVGLGGTKGYFGAWDQAAFELQRVRFDGAEDLRRLVVGDR